MATKLDLYSATSDSWRTDHGFQSTIRLKNMLDVTSVDVSLVLYMADGTPYPLPGVHLGKSSVATVNINAALAVAPASVAAHISQSGSAMLQYRYDWAGAVLGTISILDTVRSLQYVSRFVFPEPMKGNMAMGSAGNTPGAINVIQGMWRKYSASSSVFLSIVNPMEIATQADVSVSDSQNRPLGKRHFSLAAHASEVAILDDLIGAGPNTMLGGLEISYSGGKQDVLFTGGIEDDEAGYSAKLPLSMAIESMPTGNAPEMGNGSTCTVASAGLMVGTPDPMEGFPSTVKFLLFGFARNTGSKPLTLQGIANYMDKSGPHTIPLPNISIAPGETRDLNLTKSIHLPFLNGMVNVAYTYGSCGSLMLSTASVDTTGSYVFEVDPQTVGKKWGQTSHFWQVGAGTDTMYSIWNPTSQPEDLAVTIHYEPGGTYEYPLHLDGNASAMISILDLIRMATPDDKGRIIPAVTRMGSLRITGSSADPRDMLTFVVSGGIYNPVAGTCCNQYWTCDGASGSQVVVGSYTIPVGGGESQTYYITQDNATQLNYTSSASWSSSNTAVLTVKSGGAVTGAGAGSALDNASVTNYPIYVAQFCGMACPTGGQGASGSGSVASMTCSPSSVPWLGTVTCTITGAQASQVTGWNFLGSGVADSGPGGTLAWSGPMLVGGTVSATVGGVNLSQSVSVAARTGFSRVSMPPANLLANGSMVGSIQLPILVSPPNTSPGSFGASAYGFGFSFQDAAVQSGPNVGVFYVTSFTDSSAFGWELNPGVTNPSDPFYQHQGNCYASISAIVNAVQVHEIGLPGPSHYSEIQAALTADNPGTVAAQTIGSSSYIQMQVQDAYQSALNAGVTEPPTNLPSNINYPPYGKCP